MDLAEFLLARIAEDAVAAEVRPVNGRISAGYGDRWIVIWDPSRILAECEAKRRLVELHGPGEDWNHRLVCEYCESLCHSSSGLGCDIPDAPYPCLTVRLLVLPYAGHPDFREEWKP